MREPRLFRLAHENVEVHAYHEAARGWHLILRARRGDETWEDAERETFSGLTTSEMADVVCAWLHSELGLL